MQTLRMVGLYKITEQSVFQFIHTAHELKYLDITQCDKRAPQFPSPPQFWGAGLTAAELSAQ